MDTSSAIASSTLIWAAALIGVGILLLYVFRDWNSSRRILKAKDIDQQLVKEELRDAKRCAKARKGSKFVIMGDRAIEAEAPKKIIGMIFTRKFVTIYFYENFWTWGVVDVFRPLAPYGFDSKHIRINGIGIKTVKGRSTVTPNSESGISWEEVEREWHAFRIANHMSWAVAQSASQLNKGIYDATVLKGEQAKGSVLSNIDEYQFKELAKQGAEKFVR